MKRDLTGLTFNRLTVIGFSHRDQYSKAFWICRCSCGTERPFEGNNIRIGHSKSCGCHKKEMAKKPRISRALPAQDFQDSNQLE